MHTRLTLCVYRLGSLLALTALLVSCQSPTATPAPPPPTAVAATVEAATNTPMPTPVPSDTPAPTTAPTETPTLPPSATATLPATQTPTPAPLFTLSQNTFIRSGPGTNYAKLSSATAGQQFSVVGCNANRTWLVILLEDERTGQQGWVNQSVGQYPGDIQSLTIIAAPPTPTPSRTPTPTPTNTPLPTATPTPYLVPTSAHNVTGLLVLCDNKPSYAAVIERICFNMLIRNLSGSMINYSYLGVQAVNLSGGPSQFHTSWSGDPTPLQLCPMCTGPTGSGWNDGMYIAAPGTYRLTLNICYGSVSECASNTGWEVLTPGVTVNVVSWTPSP